MSNPDKAELKNREHDNWASAAAGWKRRDELLRKGSSAVSGRMLELAGISPGARLLDIASGTGEPAISAAQIVGDSGKVIGTDLVRGNLAYERQTWIASAGKN